MMHRIISPSDLLPGASYWLRSKHMPEVTRTETLMGTPASHGVWFTHHRVLATKDNPQAFDRWEIWGPIPEPEAWS